MFVRRKWMTVIASTAVLLLVSCASNPEGYQAGPVESRLTNRVFKGEWRPGFLYQITFRGIGRSMSAMVHVVDSDGGRREYNMPALVVVEGSKVELRFTNFNRVDQLIYDDQADSLSGQTVFEGKVTHRLFARGM